MNWMKFLSYINGVSYVFEGYMVNEFTYPISCSPAQIVPFNAPFSPVHQSCAFPGNRPNSPDLAVQGADYLRSAFGYEHKNLWRNVGVVIAFTVLYLVPTVLAAEMLPFAGEGSGSGGMVFARRKSKKEDLEKGISRQGSDRTARVQEEEEKNTGKELDGKAVFTWKDVNYTIDGHHLLVNVDGYVKPGEMTVGVFIFVPGMDPVLTEFILRR